jgi:hypothetical protein
VPRALARRVGPERRVHLLVLVTGCGRSGTRYTTFVLRRLGLDVGHERLGRDGVASWSLAVDADHVPWGPSPRALSFDVILHQTRHPLPVVNSAMSFKDESWRFICEHIPCSLDDPLPLRAAAYWYHWNAAAERRADLTFRVENVRCVLGEICERLGVEADSSVLDRVPTDVNTRRNGRAFHLAEEAVERLRLEPVPWLRARLAHDCPIDAHPPVGWQDIHALDPALCDRMLAMAAGYGYEP